MNRFGKKFQPKIIENKYIENNLKVNLEERLRKMEKDIYSLNNHKFMINLIFGSILYSSISICTVLGFYTAIDVFSYNRNYKDKNT